MTPASYIRYAERSETNFEQDQDHNTFMESKNYGGLPFEQRLRFIESSHAGKISVHGVHFVQNPRIVLTVQLQHQLFCR